MPEQRFTVGQTVVMRERAYRGQGRDIPVTISRIGRKYVYVQRHGREIGFDAVTGRESVEGHYDAYIVTAEGWTAYDARRDAMERLSKATNGYSWQARLTTEEADAIVAIIEAAQARGLQERDV